MTIYDEDGYTSAVFSGDQYTDSELFGGADQTVTPTNVNHDMQTGNALHPNSTYNHNVDCGSFNFPYAGVFSGQVVLKVTSTVVILLAAAVCRRCIIRGFPFIWITPI
jgi:hypothetical protein